MSAKKTSGGGELLNHDEWGEGLRVQMKTLNTKSVKRAKTPDEVLLVVLQHNLREGNEDHRHRSKIDPNRRTLNTVLRGATTPQAVVDLAASFLAELRIKPKFRHDMMMGIELVFQPPPGWDVPQFFDTCLARVDARYGARFVLSAVVHRDQKRPHMHVVVLPITADGRLAGNELTSGKVNGKDAQRYDFMAHIRATLGLRPDREALTKLATSTGKGPKTRAAAAKSDAALERRTGAGMSNPIAHQPHSPSDPIAETPYCAPPTASTSPGLGGAFAAYFWRFGIGTVDGMPAIATNTVTPTPGDAATPEPAAQLAALASTHRPFVIPASRMSDQPVRAATGNVVVGPWPHTAGRPAQPAPSVRHRPWVLPGSVVDDAGIGPVNVDSATG